MPNDQCDTSAQIPPVVHNLCKTINRKRTLNRCIRKLTRTNTTGYNHKACVCVICDCFIIGVEKINWLSEEKLIAKQSCLSVDFLQVTTNKTIPVELRNQYKIEDKDSLSHLLLSPRAHVKDEAYMACDACYRHILYNTGDKPPKFAICN